MEWEGNSEEDMFKALKKKTEPLDTHMFQTEGNHGMEISSTYLWELGHKGGSATFLLHGKFCPRYHTVILFP